MKTLLAAALAVSCAVGCKPVGKGATTAPPTAIGAADSRGGDGFDGSTALIGAAAAAGVGIVYLMIQKH